MNQRSEIGARSPRHPQGAVVRRVGIARIFNALEIVQVDRMPEIPEWLPPEEMPSRFSGPKLKTQQSVLNPHGRTLYLYFIKCKNRTNDPHFHFFPN